MFENFRIYERRVSYYETDAMRIVHHSNYLRWFEDSRVDFMEQINYPFQLIEEQGLMMPCLSAFCEYKQAAVFNDVVLVIPKIDFFNGFKITVTYRIIRKSDGVLLAAGETKHCFTDLNMNPVRTNRSHPEIFELFKKSVGVDFMTIAQI